jgi:hypothetical protein
VGYYAISSGKHLPTLRRNVVPLSSGSDIQEIIPLPELFDPEHEELFFELRLDTA